MFQGFKDFLTVRHIFYVDDQVDQIVTDVEEFTAKVILRYF